MNTSGYPVPPVALPAAWLASTMRRVLLGCWVAACVAALPAATLSTEERERARDELHRTRDAVLAAAADLSPEQWSFKPAADRWSVGDIVEHIAATEAGLLAMVQEKVMKAPARTEAVDLKETDALVLSAISDRTKKAEAPEPFIPKNRFGSAGGTLAQFKSNREKTLSFLDNTNDLRDHATDSPLGRPLDGYQWLLFISAHADRHLKQLLEVKADPNFPPNG